MEFLKNISDRLQRKLIEQYWRSEYLKETGGYAFNLAIRSTYMEHSVANEKYRDKLISNQRAFLRFACSYRIVSAEALRVITAHRFTGHWASQIHQADDGHISENKKGVREEIVDIWQSCWQANPRKAPCTKRHTPDLRSWVKCGFRGSDHDLTQFLIKSTSASIVGVSL